MPDPQTIFDLSLNAVVAILGLAILLVVFRLLRGPTLPDRVVALDMIATLAAGAIAVYAILVGQPVFLFVAIVLALVMFVGTVAFAFYLEKGVRSRRDIAVGSPGLPPAADAKRTLLPPDSPQDERPASEQP